MVYKKGHCFDFLTYHEDLSLAQDNLLPRTVGQTRTDKIILESFCGSFIFNFFMELRQHSICSLTVEENDSLGCNDREQPATTCSSMNPRAITAQYVQ